MTDKPPYRVPLMSEVRKLRPNGLKVASLFAGCGGSSTGYRMAGFRLVWANEFVPVAQESYAANMDPRTVLDGRDVAKVKGSEILEATGLGVGELDVLDGSPPCQAFSMAGKRDKGWGTERAYEHGASQKNEDLFFEYCRIRDELMPRTFVAENVSGLVKGVAKGYFLEILGRLKVGYRVEAQLLDAQWLGVPQQRQRIIFVGVRDDVAGDPSFPRPLQYRYSVREALPHLSSVGNIRSTGFAPGQMTPASEPSPTIMAGGGGGKNTSQFGVRIIQGDGVDWKNKGREIDIDGQLPAVAAGRASKRSPTQFEVETVIRHGSKSSHSSIRGEGVSLDAPMPTVMANSSCGNQFDLREVVIRHGNGSAHSSNRGNSVSLDKPLTTLIANAGAKGGQFSLQESIIGVGGRGGFGNKVVSSADGPASTIGTVPNSGNGLNPPGTAYVKDAEGLSTKRKFTIAELRRICAFPDDFVLKGSYAQQWERLGNSVPPVMMFHIASALRDGVLLPASAKRTGRAPRSAGRSTSDKPPKGAGRSRPHAAPGGTSGGQGRPRPRRTPATRPTPAGRAGGAPAPE